MTIATTCPKDCDSGGCGIETFIEKYRWIIICLAIGLLIRFILAPITSSPYDMAGWAKCIESLYSGDKLYASDHYFYPPVFGSVLGIIGALMSVLSIAPFGNVIVGLSSGIIFANNAMMTTMEFNFLMKLPLILFDVLTSVAAYKLVLKITADTRKAEVGFAIFFLSPVTILASSVLSMFECIAVCFMLLSIIAALEEKYLLAGILISLGTFTKIFPAMIIPALAGYVLSERSIERSIRIRNLGLAIAGFLLAGAVIYGIVAAFGDLSGSFAFIFNRFSSGAGGGTTTGMNYRSIIMLAVVGIVELATFIIAWRGWGDRHWRLALMIILGSSVYFAIPIVSITATYGVFLIPALVAIYCLDSRLAVIPGIAIMVYPAIGITYYNQSLLYALAANTSILDIHSLNGDPMWICGCLIKYAFLAGLINIAYVAYCLYRTYEKEGAKA